MKQLSILSGAGLNIGISQACPHAIQMLDFTYKKISLSVYEKIDPKLRAMFEPESFDYILGGLLTVNLAIEKTKQDLQRFKMNEESFSNLFQQPQLQASIIAALEQLENQLTVSPSQMLHAVNAFNGVLNKLTGKYESINYFTVNFDGIFDHILLGPQYCRSSMCTDFWRGNGTLDQKSNGKIKIHHLHGDLRYKPTKRTKQHTPPYRWPLLVVGDHEVKKGIIAGHESLTFYKNRLDEATRSKDGIEENVLAIIGFGFRDEDQHIVKRIQHAVQEKIFDRIVMFDLVDHLSKFSNEHKWVSPKDENLIKFLERL